MDESLIYTSPYDDKDYERFLQDLIKYFELDVTGYKQHRVRRRIDILMKKYNYKTYPDYMNDLRKDAKKWDEFLDKLTINVTEFFRNPEKWDYVKSTILPQLLKENQSLKAWSAGCSTGEEPYTLSIIFEELKAKSASILAADLDKFVLAKAREGVYEERSFVSTSPAIKDKYFTKLPTGKFQVNPMLKTRIKFTQINLLTDKFDKNFDLIICRNVVIYFDNEAKDNLYRKFSEALRPGGILFVGSTERIFNYREIGLKTIAPFFYQKES